MAVQGPVNESGRNMVQGCLCLPRHALGTAAGRGQQDRVRQRRQEEAVPMEQSRWK